MHPSSTWFANSLILLSILCILWNLGAALFALLCDRSAGDKMLRSLLRRMVWSFLLFGMLLGATALGWIVPRVLPISLTSFEKNGLVN